MAKVSLCIPLHIQVTVCDRKEGDEYSNSRAEGFREGVRKLEKFAEPLIEVRSKFIDIFALLRYRCPGCVSQNRKFDSRMRSSSR